LLQEAQLSQRDRATAAWVSFGHKLTKRGYSAPNLICLYLTTAT